MPSDGRVGDDPWRAFCWLLPLGGLALPWSVGILLPSVVLQTLELAEHTPERVLLMPWALRRCGPDAFSGALLAFSALGPVLGPIAGRAADAFGMKATCIVCSSLQLLGALLAAWTWTYILGVLLLAVGLGFAQPVVLALFVSQFDDERLTQKLVTVLYAVCNLSYLLATVTAGVQPFFWGYLESAAFTAIGLACLLLAGPAVRPGRAAGSAAAAGNHTAGEALSTKVSGLKEGRLCDGDVRASAYGLLCIFTLIFFVVFSNATAGPFLLFAKETIGPIGSTTVPTQWFLGLNGLIDLCLGVPLAMMYSRYSNVRFYTKLLASFVLMGAACALLSCASAARPAGSFVHPFIGVLFMLLLSLGELHYNPVMLAAISTEFPEGYVGQFIGIHSMLSGAGGALAGAGVPLYKSSGPTVFFAGCCGLCAVGAGGLHLLRPVLRRRLEGEARPLLEATTVRV
mmetsp:Transcript_6173/g.18339  ORF Transcript_6173/g.18339 Transcript_6173/m.18339 type:complete len:457 (-) Transcript_6173:62-1432(-)